MKIVAIDFETANGHPESACSMALVEANDFDIIRQTYFLIKPPIEFQNFRNGFIHHIYLDDVKNEYDFSNYYNVVKDYLNDSVIVAHNAIFDLKVLNKLFDYYKLEKIELKYIDTVQISRILYKDLENHKLSTVSKHINFSFNHHNALDDSLACLNIFFDGLKVLKDDIYKYIKIINN